LFDRAHPIEHIHPGTVATRTAVDNVALPILCEQLVAARTSPQNVVTRPSLEHVIAGPSDQDVVTVPCADGVVASPPTDDVVTLRVHEDVGVGRTDDRAAETRGSRGGREHGQYEGDRDYAEQWPHTENVVARPLALNPSFDSGKIHAGSEENAPMIRLTLLVVLAALALPSSGIAGVGQTSIFYYPWYGTPARDGAYQHWAQDGHLPPADVASGYYPVRGAYSSGNPKVVRAQMREIAAAGIREVVSSWWGWGSPEDLRLPLVIQSAKKSGLQVAVQIEPYEKWQRTADVLQNDLSHLRDLGIKRVYVYRPFDGVIDDAGWKLLNGSFGALQILAQTANVARAATDGFDGVYTYDIVNYGARTFAPLCMKAHAAGLLCAPSVGPGYNAFRATGDVRSRPRNKGAFYDSMWSAAIGARPDQVTITSYNEWHEGTQIEPARSPAPRYRASIPITFPYSSYDGAYGSSGKAAQRAYLVRTAFWTSIYRTLASAQRLLASL
jgi:glycoprotein endo-alpha-1,2-mannosidase